MSSNFDKTRWISVHLLNGTVENHPDVVSIDCQADLTLHLSSGGYVTYKDLIWDHWHVTSVAKILKERLLNRV